MIMTCTNTYALPFVLARRYGIRNGFFPPIGTENNAQKPNGMTTITITITPQSVAADFPVTLLREIKPSCPEISDPSHRPPLLLYTRISYTGEYIIFGVRALYSYYAPREISVFASF